MDANYIFAVFSDKRSSEIKLDKDDELVVEELTDTLKEWNKALRNYFVTASKDMVSVPTASTRFAFLVLFSPHTI